MLDQVPWLVSVPFTVAVISSSKPVPARMSASSSGVTSHGPIDVAVIGSGVRRSKLLVPGPLLGELPGAEVVEGLAR